MNKEHPLILELMEGYFLQGGLAVACCIVHSHFTAVQSHLMAG